MASDENNKMVKICFLSLCIWLSSALMAAFAWAALPGGNKISPAGTASAVKHRVVVQVNEEDGRKWTTILGNLRNIQAELGRDKVAITVVAIGGGLGMLKADSVAANDVIDALAAGVRFIACGNSMQALHIPTDDLVERVEVAKAGYVEIMRLQQQGWSYLRP